MRVLIQSGGASILNGEEFTSFDFVSDLGAAELGQAMSKLALGVTDEGGDHAWFTLDALRRLAAPFADEQWDGRLQAMADYASSRGWTDSEGRIRAHHERPA